MAFTEFYCDFTNGNNTYSGSTEAAPVLSLTGGDWVSATGVFTKTGQIANVSVGMFAAVRVDGASVSALDGRVTAVDANTVTISTTAKSGSLADQTGTCSIVVGGPKKGPNAAVAHPFGFVTNAQTNAAGDTVRYNFKNNATYAITAAMTHGNAGPVVFQGYTSTVGDGGRAIIDGGTAGASYVLLTASAGFAVLEDLIFQNNGATGSANGVSFTTVGYNQFRRCVFHDIRGIGLVTAQNTNGQAAALIEECEFYLCGKANTSALAGVQGSNNTTLLRCFVHDNAGSNVAGVRVTTACQLIDCVIDTNGASGVNIAGNATVYLDGCDVYNNVGDGVLVSISGGSVSLYAENSNFVKNGTGGSGYAVNRTGTANLYGRIQNCGFGSGSQANASGTTNNVGGLVEAGSVTYAAGVTPWRDPAAGDFTITLAAAKAAGRGSFTQTQAGYGTTTAVPDIGAGQASSAGGGGKFWPRRLR